MPHSKQEAVEAFREQLAKGSIQAGYRALLGYLEELRAHIEELLPDAKVSAVYPGRMDLSYFALFPPSLAARQLKVAVVFDYDAFALQVWLAGRNRQAQRRAWTAIRGGRWPKYRVLDPGPGVDAILVHDLARDFDLARPGTLTATAEKGTLAFIADVERFLAKG